MPRIVYIHEFAHVQLHKDTRRSETTRIIRETEAETVASIVSHAIGLDTNTASSDYLSLYKGDKQILLESLTHIQQTASQILSAVISGELAGRVAAEANLVAHSHHMSRISSLDSPLPFRWNKDSLPGTEQGCVKTGRSLSF